MPISTYPVHKKNEGKIPEPPNDMMRKLRMKVIRDNFKWFEYVIRDRNDLVAWIDEVDECVKISHKIST